MIGYLKGTPKVIGSQLVIDVGGVGYAVQVGPNTFAQIGQQTLVELIIYTHVRENTLELFGFLSVSEKTLFERLLDVSGVGPKTALHIADRGAGGITQAVQNADIGFFTQLPRVGKKLAQKIIIELKPKLGSLKELDLKPESKQYTDVLEALENLGYATSDIQSAIQSVDIESMNLQTAIKMTMKFLAGK
jgi:Holliday junction DNA helicase RuvA